MLKFWALLTAALLFTGCTVSGRHDDSQDLCRCSPAPQMTDECERFPSEVQGESFVKAMWISYIDLSPMLEKGTAEDFRDKFSEACENVCELGFNTLFVHVRAFGDALYHSNIYPPSDMAGDFDALEIMCDTAHEHGLELHAWINPLRLQNADRLAALEGWQTYDWYSSNTGEVMAVEGDEHLWLDPAFSEVRDFIAEGAAEIAGNYEVDGIHYDDYFYPTTDEAFDAQCYSQFSEGIGLEDWRRENINKLCREIYSKVKAKNENITVSISPQGNIRNNYDLMYADVAKWCAEEGYCDMMIPQIYFGYDNSVKPFLRTLDEWRALCGAPEPKLVIGLAAYKIGTEDDFTDNVGIIAKQIADCAECGGVAVYTYSSFFGEDSSDPRIISEKQAVSAALDEC
ncbi:MAG: family 10 glycosylhydrolase [Ruminococcus sp.]|nr:family 10 glycosylhydrolase [Ruminococcus sp.]